MLIKQTLGFSQPQMNIQFVKEMLTNSPRRYTCLDPSDALLPLFQSFCLFYLAYSWSQSTLNSEDICS